MKNQWYYVYPYSDISKENNMKIFDMLEYSRYRIWYRYNDMHLLDDNTTHRNFFYEDEMIFSSRKMMCTQKDISFERIMLQQNGIHLPVVEHKWYELKPEHLHKVLHPVKNGNINVILSGTENTLLTYVYYINIFEYDDFVLAINTSITTDEKMNQLIESYCLNGRMCNE